MDLSTITATDFKARFYRDFYFANQNPDQQQPIPPNIDLVQDLDISNAFSDAQNLLNQALFGDATAIRTAYLLLSAHMLCNNIKAADSGANSGGTFPVSARSVGSVSETYLVPDDYKNDPLLATYTTTAYGMKYLQMVLPAIRGNMLAVCSVTNP